MNKEDKTKENLNILDIEREIQKTYEKKAFSKALIIFEVFLFMFPLIFFIFGIISLLPVIIFSTISIIIIISNYLYTKRRRDKLIETYRECLEQTVNQVIKKIDDFEPFRKYREEEKCPHK